jgi:prolyl-tRNA editing enzyme YbaK/EbsC (Cys-tRNA(Pro) deacylase)
MLPEGTLVDEVGYPKGCIGPVGWRESKNCAPADAVTMPTHVKVTDTGGDAAGNAAGVATATAPAPAPAAAVESNGTMLPRSQLVLIDEELTGVTSVLCGAGAKDLSFAATPGELAKALGARVVLIHQQR